MNNRYKPIELTVIEFDLAKSSESTKNINRELPNEGLILFMKQIDDFVKSSFDCIKERSNYDDYTQIKGDNYRIWFLDLKNAYNFVKIFCEKVNTYNTYNTYNNQIQVNERVFRISAVTASYSYNDVSDNARQNRLIGVELETVSRLIEVKPKGYFYVDQNTYERLLKLNLAEGFEYEWVRAKDRGFKAWRRRMINYKSNLRLNKLLKPETFDLDQSMHNCITMLEQKGVKRLVIFYSGTEFPTYFELRLQQEVHQQTGYSCIKRMITIDPLINGKENLKKIIKSYKKILETENSTYILFSAKIEKQGEFEKNLIIDNLIDNGDFKDEEIKKIIIIFYVKINDRSSDIKLTIDVELKLQHFYFEEQHAADWIDKIISEVDWQKERSKDKWQKKLCERSAYKNDKNKLVIDEVYSYIKECNDFLQTKASMTTTELENEFINYLDKMPKLL